MLFISCISSSRVLEEFRPVPCNAREEQVRKAWAGESLGWRYQQASLTSDRAFHRRPHRNAAPLVLH